MFSAFQTFGRLGAGARAVAAAWTPAALWPTGTEPGMWIDPSNLDASWADSTGTTPVSPPGTVADSSNPVGLALDLRLGATVLTDPGNHLLQATSTARPLLSGRVNLLTYTEDFSNSAWDKFRSTISSNAVIAPDGTLTADAVIPNVTTNSFVVQPAAAQSVSSGSVNTFSIYAKKAAFNWLYLDMYDGTFPFAYFDIDTGALGTVSAGVTATITEDDNGFYRLTISVASSATFVYCRVFAAASDLGIASPPFDGTGVASHYQWGAQFNRGNPIAYQPVPGNGSTYPSTGFPIFQKFDGTDDGMATASFPAGTLSNNMDCLIAMRRDSAGLTVLGLYDQDINYWFGAPDATDSTQVCYGICGTPTVWVDGVQLPGGIAVKRDTLASALPIGQWCILEFRSLDLSGWTAAGFGAYYTGFYSNGARGDILLFPTPSDPSDRDKARAYLAAKYGVTLP